MITLLLTIKLMYVLDSNQHCGVSWGAEGCYKSWENVIYINKGETTRPADFILFHELCHAKFNYIAPIELFNNHAEVLADSCALWVYNHKYIGQFNEVTGKRKEYFDKMCDKKCIDELVTYKVPYMTYPIKPFVEEMYQ